jgi:hypothetical protein
MDRPLEQIRIARPCPARWEDMAGDDRARFCSLCRKNVYNLSSLSREAAVRLIAEHEGALCARLYRRGDGTILTADCPVGSRAFAVRVSQRFAAAVAGLLLILGGRHMTPVFKERLHKVAPGATRTSAYPSQQELEESLRSLGYISFDSSPAKPKR